MSDSDEISWAWSTQSTQSVLLSLKSHGFTLMEVLVAMVITALGVAIFLQLFSASINLERRSRGAMQDMMVADRVMEELMRQDVRDAGFAWHGEQEDMSWELRLSPVEIRTLMMEDQETPLRLPMELFRYDLTYARKTGPQREVVRYVTYPLDFFDEQMRGTLLQNGQ